MIRSTLTYKYAVGMGIFFAIFWTIIIGLIFATRGIFILLYFAFGTLPTGFLIIASYAIAIIILIDKDIPKKDKIAKSKAHPIRIIVECLFINFYLLQIAFVYYVAKVVFS